MIIWSLKKTLGQGGWFLCIHMLSPESHSGRPRKEPDPDTYNVSLGNGKEKHHFGHKWCRWWYPEICVMVTRMHPSMHTEVHAYNARHYITCIHTHIRTYIRRRHAYKRPCVLYNIPAVMCRQVSIPVYIQAYM